MNDNDTFVTVGKIGATYGIQGWLKIQTYTEFGASILEYKPWYLNRPHSAEWQEVTIEDGRSHGKGVIVKFPEFHNPEDAKILTGCLIAVKRSQLPSLEKNEYYWSDLIGLTVIDLQGQTLGIVDYLMETGSNDVLVIKNGKEHAIPFLLDKVIKEINLEKKTIIVDWELF